MSLKIKSLARVVCAVIVLSALLLPAITRAQSEEGTFSLQVTPSPLVITTQPGQTTTTDLKIRNNGDKTESLKIEPKSFAVNGENGQVTLGDSAPADVGSWISFSNQTFTIAPGEWFTEKVTVSLPAQTGFSYSFALIISRANSQPTVKPGESALRGSVAVFTLISVDRPGAKKELTVTDFHANQRVYEYLPAEFTVTLKNTGNTIVMPGGTVFIQRSSGDATPLATLAVNSGNGYILPGTSRSFTAVWQDGFPAYTSVQAAANTESKQQLTWDWSKASNFRFGRYSAKLVAVYNDGSRDIPLEAQTTFWVIPWKLIAIALVPLLLILVGIVVISKKTIHVFKKVKRSSHGDESNT